MAVTDYNATITKTGETAVDVMLQLVEHNFDKVLVDIEVPEKDEDNDPLTWLIDLRRLKETITLTGWLQDESGSSGLTKKNNLRSILQSAGTMTVAWGTGVNAQSYTANIAKASIKELPERRTDSAATLGSETKVFHVMIQFILGTHKG